jgi:hypothetical protein
MTKTALQPALPMALVAVRLLLTLRALGQPVAIAKTLDHVSTRERMRKALE